MRRMSAAAHALRRAARREARHHSRFADAHRQARRRPARRSSRATSSGAIAEADARHATRRATDSGSIGLHPYDDPVAVFQLDGLPDHRRACAGGVATRSWTRAACFPPPTSCAASVRLAGDDGASVVMEGGDAWPRRDGVLRGRPVGDDALVEADASRARRSSRERGRRARGERVVRAGERRRRRRAARVRARPRAGASAARSSSTRTPAPGATAIPLARDGVRVVAIESDRDAARGAPRCCRAGSRVVAARVEDVIDECASGRRRAAQSAARRRPRARRGGAADASRRRRAP